MYVGGVKSGVCGFMQHCIQSNVAHVRGVEGVLYIQWPLTPPGGKAI